MKNWFSVARWVFLIAVIAFAIYSLYPHFSDFIKLKALKNSVDYIWIFAGLACQVGEYVTDGWLSQTLLQILNVRIDLKHTLMVASLDVFAAHLLPIGDLGGLAAAYHFYRKLGATAEQFFFLSFTWGILTTSCLILYFLLAIIFMPQVSLPFHTTTIGLSIFGLVVVLCVILLAFRKFILRHISQFLARYSWSKDFAHFIAHRRDYVHIMRQHKRLMTEATAAAALYYVLDIGTLVCAFLAFHVSPPIALIIFGYTIALVLGRIGLTPAGLGTAEAVLLVVFINAGIDPSIAVAIVLIFRLLSFWLCIPTGFAAYLLLKRELA